MKEKISGKTAETAQIKEQEVIIGAEGEGQTAPDFLLAGEDAGTKIEEGKKELEDLYAKAELVDEKGEEEIRELVSAEPKTEKEKITLLGNIKKRLGWLRGLALGGMLALGTAEMASPVIAQDKAAEKKEDSKESYQKNLTYLREVFSTISGGGLAAGKKEGLIVHVGGGKYYEVSRPMLGELVTLAGDYRLKMERTKNKDVALTLRRASQMKIREEVSARGAMVPFDELPQVLRDFEKARKEQ